MRCPLVSESQVDGNTGTLKLESPLTRQELDALLATLPRASHALREVLLEVVEPWRKCGGMARKKDAIYASDWWGMHGEYRIIRGASSKKKKKSVGQKIVQELWLGLSESGHWPYARAWWTVFSASKLVDISHNPLQHAPTLKRLQFQTKPNWLNPRKSVPLPSSPGLRRSPVRFLPFHASPHYGRALHGQLPSCACIWSHGVEKDTAGVKPRRGWEVIGGTNGDRDRTYYLLR